MYGKGRLLVGLAVIVFAVGLNGSIMAGNITIKYSDHDAPGGIRTNFLSKVWIPEIVKQTGGTVKVQDFWGGALFGGKEALKSVGDGVVQMSFVFPEFYPKQLPLHQIFKLFPRGPKEWKNQNWFYKTIYKEVPELAAELKKWNQMPLLILSGLPCAFASSKPLTKLSDLKGRKWRASSRWALEYLKNFGATPVSVPWADCYMAMQTGTFDGIFTAYHGIHNAKLDEVGPNILVSKELWWATPMTHTINLTFWNSLSKEVQGQILKACEVSAEKFGEPFSKEFERILAAEKKAGAKVIIMDAEMLAEWEEQSGYLEIQKVWLKEIKGMGINNADQILAKFRDIHNQAMAKEK